MLPVKKQDIKVDKTGLNIGVLTIELQDDRASKLMDEILEARMHEKSKSGFTRKGTKGWKVVREKLVSNAPIQARSVDNFKSEAAVQQKAGAEVLIRGQARGWKVLRKRVENRKFTEDLRQSNLRLNRMDERVPSKSHGKPVVREGVTGSVTLAELENENASCEDYQAKLHTPRLEVLNLERVGAKAKNRKKFNCCLLNCIRTEKIDNL